MSLMATFNTTVQLPETPNILESTVIGALTEIATGGPRCAACNERLYGRNSIPGYWGRNWCGRIRCWCRIASQVWKERSTE